MRVLAALLVCCLAVGCAGEPAEVDSTPLLTTTHSATTTMQASPEATTTTSTTTASNAPRSTTTPAAPEPVHEEPLLWVRTESGLDAWADAIIQVDDQLLIVGSNGGGSPSPMAWTSPDGFTWTELDHWFASEGWLRDAAATDWGIVAVGHTGGFAVDWTTAAIWVEIDSSWRQVPNEDGLFDDMDGAWSEAFGVVSDGPLSIVGGYGVGSVDGGNITYSPTLWLTTDGVDWVRLKLSDERGTVRDVVRFQDSWVAVGSIRVGDSRYAASWKSDDGYSWVQTTEVSDESLGEMRKLATNNNTLVALGEPWIWTSEDGVAWVRYEFGEVAPFVAGFEAITVHGDIYYMAGYEGRLGLVWASRDGSDWEIVSDSDVYQDSGPQGWAIATTQTGGAGAYLLVFGPADSGLDLYSAPLP